MLFPTTIVGSFPQPEWLIDRARLAGPERQRNPPERRRGAVPDLEVVDVKHGRDRDTRSSPRVAA